jgi:soluble lytic murein transglycosylase
MGPGALMDCAMHDAPYHRPVMRPDSWFWRRLDARAKAARGFRLPFLAGLVLIAFALFGSPLGAAEPLPLPASKDDLSVLREALDATQRGDFALATRTARRAGAPVVLKIVQWLDYRRADTAASFEEFAAFFKANPDWPEFGRIEAAAERAMAAGLDDAGTLAWFHYRDPVSREGRLRLLDALSDTGETKRATDLARAIWLEDDFGETEETDFLTRYDRLLRIEDHQARLNRLLWDNKETSAKRMYQRVDKAWQALAEARLALHADAKNASNLLAKVPARLRRDPGLIYERVRWRRLNERDDEARALLLGVKTVKDHANLWWQERRRLARQALEKGQSRDAYRLAAAHGLEGGAAFAEAEFFAGWVALRFRHDAKTALCHFTRLHEAVSSPISLARGAYWAGRAAEATGAGQAAKGWYAKAAQWPATFYGQLAAARLSPKTTAMFAAAERVAAKRANTFHATELVAAARLLAVLGEDSLVPPFILRLGELARGPNDHALLADLALDMARPDLAVRAAKLAASQGYISLGALYPTVKLPYPKAERLERPLVLALTRQESQFDPDAKSPAGALGLMQLMPATARAVGKEIGLKVKERELITSQALNVRLGSLYLAEMLDRFGGSYMLAVAAYNAGPANVGRWLAANGDPRADATIDPIDWIEAIPIEETRNYVQRVLEATQVYRWRLGKAVTVDSLERDLVRGVEKPVLLARCKTNVKEAVRANTLRTVC